MKFWLRKQSAPARRIVSTFSTWAIVGLCFAGPFTDLEHRVEGANTPKALVQVLKNAPKDDQLEILSNTVANQIGAQQKLAAKAVRDYIATRASAERLGTDSDALAQVQKIKRSPLYHDEDLAASNWFGKAGQALYDMLKRLLDSLKFKQQNGPNLALGGLFGTWMIFLMWGILAALIITLGYLAIRHAHWKKRLKRKTTALLEEDEPERTLDEWLERADQLERTGQYREAVRCLYLACLLRFDEARVARFDRGQTNWEHLARIRVSPLLPAGLDFEPTTKAFDQIWYGMKSKGKDDVELFRGWYLDFSERLLKKAA